MRQVSSKFKHVDITGYATPFYSDGSPVIVQLEQSHFIAVFSTFQKCLDAIEHMQLKDVKVKGIDDSQQFLNSIREANQQGANIRVMVDPYIVDGEKTRFTELWLNGQ